MVQPKKIVILTSSSFLKGGLFVVCLKKRKKNKFGGSLNRFQNLVVYHHFLLFLFFSLPNTNDYSIEAVFIIETPTQTLDSSLAFVALEEEHFRLNFWSHASSPPKQPTEKEKKKTTTTTTFFFRAESFTVRLVKKVAAWAKSSVFLCFFKF